MTTSTTYPTHPTTDAPTVRLPRTTARPTAPVVDSTRLWTGGMASAAVAALVALVGTLVVQVLFRITPAAVVGTHGFPAADTGLLCVLAALAALVATGVAHLLLVSTPTPLSYLGWIIGLSTAAAVVLPLVSTLPLAAAIASAALHLVIGLAIGSLVVGAAAAAHRPAAR